MYREAPRLAPEVVPEPPGEVLPIDRPLHPAAIELVVASQIIENLDGILPQLGKTGIQLTITDGNDRRTLTITEARNNASTVPAITKTTPVAPTGTGMERKTPKLSTDNARMIFRNILELTGNEGCFTPNMFRALSERELKVVDEILKACSNQQIAEALNIGTSTVATHLKSINNKLGTDNRTHVAILYMCAQLYTSLTDIETQGKF